MFQLPGFYCRSPSQICLPCAVVERTMSEHAGFRVWGSCVRFDLVCSVINQYGNELSL